MGQCIHEVKWKDTKNNHKQLLYLLDGSPRDGVDQRGVGGVSQGSHEGHKRIRTCVRLIHVPIHSGNARSHAHDVLHIEVALVAVKACGGGADLAVIGAEPVRGSGGLHLQVIHLLELGQIGGGESLLASLKDRLGHRGIAVQAGHIVVFVEERDSHLRSTSLHILAQVGGHFVLELHVLHVVLLTVHRRHLHGVEHSVQVGSNVLGQGVLRGTMHDAVLLRALHSGQVLELIEFCVQHLLPLRDLGRGADVVRVGGLPRHLDVVLSQPLLDCFGSIWVAGHLTDFFEVQPLLVKWVTRGTSLDQKLIQFDKIALLDGKDEVVGGLGVRTLKLHEIWTRDAFAHVMELLASKRVGDHQRSGGQTKKKIQYHPSKNIDECEQITRTDQGETRSAVLLCAANVKSLMFGPWNVRTTTLLNAHCTKPL